jgi:hypothetical protein
MKRKLSNIMKVVTLSLLMFGLAGGAVAQGPGPQGNPAASANSGVNPQSVQAALGTTQTKTNVSVTAGLFTIPDLDFGAAAFTGDARWLQTAVKCSGDAALAVATPISAQGP